MGGCEAGCAARIAPDAGGDEGRAGGICDCDDGWIAGSEDWLGGCAGPGIPKRVFFISGFATPIWEPEPGGGGGTAAGVRAELFFPRPSKISRSEPPPLLSSDIRVS
jgi:hypothetical protein